MISNLKKFINSDIGKILASAILGFGLASLFRKTCEHKNCMVFKAPKDLKEIQENIYNYNKECYKFTPSSMKCDKNKKILDIA